MNCYFIHDDAGKLVGSIETVSESDAAQLAEVVYRDHVMISTSPEREWYMRRELPEEKAVRSFES